MKKMLKTAAIVLLALAAAPGCNKEVQEAPVPEEARQFRELVLVREAYPLLDTLYISKDYKPRPTDVIVLDVTDWEPDKDALVFVRSGVDVTYIIPYTWQGEDTIYYTYDGSYLWINRRLVGLSNCRYEADSVGSPNDIVTLFDDGQIKLDSLKSYPNAATIGVFYSLHMGKTPTLLAVSNLMKIPKAKDIDLYISYNDISNLDFLGFAMVPNLKFLKAIPCEKENWGLSFLYLARGLREFFFSALKITSKDFSRIARISNLRRLTLESDTIEEEGFRRLKALNNLTELNINSRAIGDKALHYISELENLHVLRLINTNVTDTGLAYLENLDNLRSLDLSNSRNITDSGLVHLEKVTSLRRLKLFSEKEDPFFVHRLLIVGNYPFNLPNPHVTREGVERLRKTLPRCEIVWMQDHPW